MRLFVYGTLMHNRCNHRVLQRLNAVQVQRAVIVAQCQIVSTRHRWSPKLIFTGDNTHHVKGEIWTIPEINVLDTIERVLPPYWQRHTITTKHQPVDAYMLSWLPQYSCNYHHIGSEWTQECDDRYRLERLFSWKN